MKLINNKIKYIFTSLIIIYFFFIFNSYTHAVTTIPKISPTTSTKNIDSNTQNANQPTPSKNIEDQINNLKDRIASRVAQLKLVEKKGIIGIVTSVSGAKITITDIKNDIKFIDVDEITKFSSPSAKDSFGISDIVKGSKIATLGLYNKQSRRIMARFIDVLFTPVILQGAVVAIDEKEFTILVQLEDGQKVKVDIEKVTKTNSYSGDNGIAKFGFSKIKNDMRIFVAGYANIGDNKRITATRIIIFTDIPKNPKIKTIPNALIQQEAIVASTGSGKKLTPITR